MLITDFDLSIVVQGPINHNISNAGTHCIDRELTVSQHVLLNLRNHFKNAEIILSTWEGSDVSKLEFDRVVLNQDPGAYICDDEHQIYLNLNRQLVSTVAGLRLVERKYVLKIRSDMLFINSNCLSYWNKYNSRNDRYKLLKERVVITTVTSRNPRTYDRFPHFPCDWFYLGNTEEVLDIFDIPLTDEPSFSRWYENHPMPENYATRTDLAKYPPESYIWSSFIKKKISLNFDYYSDISNNNIEVSEFIFANNLVLCTPSQLGFLSLKYDWKIDFVQCRYTHIEWLKLYSKYCDPNLRIKPIDLERIYIFLSSKIVYLKKILPRIDDSLTLKELLKLLFLLILNLLLRIPMKLFLSLTQVVALKNYNKNNNA
jgi:hypothetical protein